MEVNLVYLIYITVEIVDADCSQEWEETRDELEVDPVGKNFDLLIIS